MKERKMVERKCVLLMHGNEKKKLVGKRSGWKNEETRHHKGPNRKLEGCPLISSKGWGKF